MTDDNADSDTTDETEGGDGEAEPPEWAKSLIDTVEQNSEQIEDLAAREKTVEIETADGETVELTEKEARDAIESDGGDPPDDAPKWAKSVVDTVERNAERIDAISEQSGYSQQLGGAEKTTTDEPDTVEAFKAGLAGRAPRPEGDEA